MIDIFFLKKKMKPIFKKFNGGSVSPSKLIEEIGRSIENENSFLHWCAKNKIPVFSPGITDSAIGLQTYFFKGSNPNFSIDVTGDMRELASICLNSAKTGAIILGGGITKHHIIGVNLLRDGLDYAVYITTSSEYDGSLSGARTKEAISWGKIREKSKNITIDCEGTIAFPLVFNKLFSK